MSIQTALDNINLVPSARWGHTEYSIEYSPKYLARKTGLEPGDPSLVRQGYDHLEMDFIWHTHNGLISWKEAGRVTNMGHAAYAVDGSDQVNSSQSPFGDEEEVWAFDAVAEYGLPAFDEQVSHYEAIIRKARVDFPNQLTTGGYYRTIVSGAIETFGWEMLLLGCSEMDKMERVFDSFFQRTKFHMEAWSQTSAEVIIQHDDFVWTSGPFMDPKVYRKVIIPRYAELWKPLRAAGKKVLFCSDGDFTMFTHDLADAGADGFIFEPVVDFDYMVENFGKSHCLVGSFVDCRALTFSKWDRVQADIDRTIKRLEDCKGALLAVGNHLPPNIPDEMFDKYFDYLLPRMERGMSSE